MPVETTHSAGIWLRATAFLAGFAVVATLVVGWRVPGGDGQPGADVVVALAPTGEIAVSRTGPFVTGTDLRGGDSARGTVTLRNQTAQTVGVSVRTLPSSRDLETLLQVSVDVGDQPVFEGPLGALREWSTPIVLGPGEARRLRVEVRLPGSDDGSQARSVSADLELRTERRS
jgi:hypothetical protein